MPRLFTRRVLRRFATDSDDLSDLTQEAWVNIFRALPQFRATCKLSCWLYRVVLNTGYTHVRRRRQARFAPMPQTLDIEDNTLTRVLVSTALEHLPPRMGSVLCLALDGDQHNEIASALSIHTGTSKSQLRKARLKLRVVLDCEKP
ncbi:MAG: RNA polymerase sigma factor [Longimicrobiales bacterium]